MDSLFQIFVPTPQNCMVKDANLWWGVQIWVFLALSFVICCHPLHRIGNASNIGAVQIFYQKTKSNLFTSFLYNNKISHKLNCNFMILIDIECVWYILLVLKKSAFDLIFFTVLSGTRE
jgi:hypothetical protein